MREKDHGDEFGCLFWLGFFGLWAASWYFFLVGAVGTNPISTGRQTPMWLDALFINLLIAPFIPFLSLMGASLCPKGTRKRARMARFSQSYAFIYPIGSIVIFWLGIFADQA